MPSVHIASYYANRFDPDTLFPELAMFKSSDVFYGTNLTALNIEGLEFTPKFEGTSVNALYVKDVATDLLSNFIPEGNPLISNQVVNTLSVVSLMATLGLTYLTNPFAEFDMGNQMKADQQIYATYSIDYNLKNIVNKLDYMTDLAFESKSENQNQFVHAGYKFFLINTIEPMESSFISNSIPSPVFIRESVLSISISI
jgi:hypothetical protein